MKIVLKIFILILTLLGVTAVTNGATPSPSEIVAAGQAKSASCVACHGSDGNSSVSSYPKIAGQYAGYLEKELRDYKLGEKGGRNNPIMFGIASGLTETDLASLSAYYSEQKPSLGAAKSTLVSLGQRLYRGGDRARGIAACMSCHGPRGDGNILANYPRVSGQNPEYTVSQLQNFRDGKRKNDPNSMMRDVAAKLTDQDMEALASYMYGLY